MGSNYQRWEEMEVMNLDWWYRIVATTLFEEHRSLKGDHQTSLLRIENQAETIRTLRAQVTKLEQPTEIGSWIHSREFAAKRRIDELEGQLEKMGLLRDALRNEKAYTLFLEDCLECLNPGDVFNALPLEKRKEYFDKVQ